MSSAHQKTSSCRSLLVGETFGVFRSRAITYLRLCRTTARLLQAKDATSHLMTRRPDEPTTRFLRFSFLLNHDLYPAGYVAMQAHRHIEFTQVLQRIVQLNFSPVDVEALMFQRFGNVSGGHRAEQMVLFS